MSARTQTRRPSARHPHDDAPDTDAAFAEIAALPEGPERTALRQEVVRAWMPMAERLARQFRNRGESLEDLQQIAALGLVKAVARYDPARGNTFASFAVPTVVGEIKRHFRDHTWGTHVPRRVQELRNRVRVAERELSHSLDQRGPSVREIAERAQLSDQEVRLGMEAMNSYAPLSLDAELPGTDDGYSLTETLGDLEPGYDRVVDREALKPRLRSLPYRERQILYLRFFGGLSQNRIAEELGISQMHVSRLLSRTCTALRDQILAEPPPPAANAAAKPPAKPSAPSATADPSTRR
ncbi:SigB/SigF/SigG family RNA polymerase sigma factor [Streptomyces palmae]|uniref:SigB/SigF/SigG family RNA polymerase sigma factor n=1 Tax=Streptomyces palmae TaxID=1701085 RepID=A0A4Z0HC66_9ACTN|nr:SigB/SigF/SigG family RNA polymerase sigma factor [Streptomyces palmae]TGB17101.1 SigB/SigF/SigG family RNA polymerase sigma factor [Streptomyces palmae]